MYVISGVFETLNVLKEKFRLAIVSNHYAWLKEYLEEIRLAPYFETIVISEIVGVEKPNVQIMQIALKELNLFPEDCLYVGDHPFDVLCAKETGMDCAWIASENSILPEIVPFKEDYKINNVKQLLGILL